MWIEIYKNRFNISDYDNVNNLENIIQLHRMECDVNGKTFIVFKYTNSINSGFFYTELEKNILIIPLINEYYNTIENEIDSRLVDIKFKVETYDRLHIIININTVMIPSYLSSQCIKTVCTIMMLQKKNMASKEISDMLISNSFIPENQTNNSIFKKKDFKIKLFDYQKNSIIRMANIENNNTMMPIPRTFELEIGDVCLLWDPFYNKVVDSHKYCNITTTGGILSDSMGLGKTLTMIGLIHYNNKTTLPISNDYISTGATLVIVPSHLAKQWAGEYTKALSSTHKIITILTKKQHDITTYKDFMEADIIIVTQQFLMNFNNYIEINYHRVSPSMYCPSVRQSFIMNVFKEWKNTNQNIESMTRPLFEFFHFQRVIIDEGHEIFERNLRSSVSVNNWLLQFINDLKSSYKWYVSGTPFTHGFINCMNYINMQLHFDDEILKIRDIKNGCIMTHNHPTKTIGANISNFILSKNFITNLLSCIIIRHQKVDVESMVQIPSYTEMIEWIELTETERSIYNSKKCNSSGLTLQQLCCHPLIVESMKKMIGINSHIVDLDQVQNMIIDYHKKQVSDYTMKITKIDHSNQAYHMILSNYNSKISESSFMLKMLEKINTVEEKAEKQENPDIICVICFSEIDNNMNSMLTPCGHIYCEECILTAIKYKAECPTCKMKIDKMSSEATSKLIRINRINTNTPIANTSTTNPLINKYGAKLGRLIQMIRQIIIQNKTNRIIIFSQWDDMLTLIGKSLSENGINNVFIKGNVHCRNKAIKTFKEIDQKEETRVIMLSLKNSASGTNLTEATHIFFIEPISMSRDESKMIEGQAIGRACRIGQKKIVQIIRILCKNTIEEDIYNSMYRTTNLLHNNLNQIDINV